jgi:hypothetical protein
MEPEDGKMIKNSDTKEIWMNLRTQSVVQNLQGTVGDVTSFK